MAKQDVNAKSADEVLPPFEQSLEMLEQIVQSIESGDVTLEQSLQQYERGTKLIDHCRTILDAAETKIKQLTLTDKGKVVATDE